MHIFRFNSQIQFPLPNFFVLPVAFATEGDEHPYC
jgi:hypothetical protein